MIFIENTRNNRKADIILEVDEAEELLDIGPKLSVSSISLMVQLHRSEFNGSGLIGCSVSRTYLQKSVEQINREAKPLSHHKQTPRDSPHYLEVGNASSHDIRRTMAITIIGFLSPPEPPTTSTDTTFKP